MADITKPYEIDWETPDYVEGIGGAGQTPGAIWKLDQNQIKLYTELNYLRNLYASTTPPENPNTGQLWLDTSVYQIKEWTGSDWAIVTNYIDIKWFNDDLAQAVNDIGSNEVNLLIPRNITVSTDTTVPENICLVIPKGGKITVDSGVTLTINGSIQAGLWQIFDGDGTVTGSPKIEAVYPEWFGAIGDGTTDDSQAIQKAIDFYNFVVLSKSYLIEMPLKLNNNSTIMGYFSDFKNLYSNTAYDKDAVKIILGNANKAFYIDPGEGKSFKLSNFSVFVKGYSGSSGDISNINYALGKIGIDISYSQDVEIENLKFYNLEYCIYAEDSNQEGAQWTARPVIKNIRSYECRYVLYTAAKTGTYEGKPYADFLIDKLVSRNCEQVVNLNDIDGVNIFNSVFFQAKATAKITNSTLVKITNCNFFETLDYQLLIKNSSHISLDNTQLVRAGWLGTTATALQLDKCSNVKLTGVVFREPAGLGLNIINSTKNVSGRNLFFYAYSSTAHPFLYTSNSSSINLQVDCFNVPVGFMLFNNDGSTDITIKTNIIRDFAGDILIETPNQQDILVESKDEITVAANGGVHILGKVVFIVPMGAKLKLLRYACYLPSGLIGVVNGVYPNENASLVAPESKNLVIYDNTDGTSDVAVTVEIGAENTTSQNITINQFHNIYCRFAIEK